MAPLERADSSLCGAGQPGGVFRTVTWPVLNVLLGSICWLALAAAVITYVTRTTRARRQGKRWYTS